MAKYSRYQGGRFLSMTATYWLGLTGTCFSSSTPRSRTAPIRFKSAACLSNAAAFGSSLISFRYSPAPHLWTTDLE